jgi:DNA-binding MarR family transcriptional regulator
METVTAQIVSTRDFVNEAHRLIDKIAQNNRVYEENCVKFFGVTTSQGGTILSIPLNSTLKMNELSKAAGVDTSTMTRMVDQLVDKGLVTRKTGEKDRRQVQIGLTITGKKLRQELAAALDNFYKDSLDQIPEKDREAIIESLLKVNEAIGKGLEECCKRYCQR